MAPVIKRKTVITWESPKRIQLEFEHIAYAKIVPNTDNIAVVIMDENLYPNNAFIYSANGKVLYTIETTADVLFYSGIEYSEENIYLYCEKQIKLPPEDFIETTYVNIVDVKGKIINSFVLR